MSWVADVILVTSLSDEDNNDLDAWLLGEYPHRGRLVRVDDHAGGNKCMQARVSIGAYNHLYIEGLVNAFRAIRWEFPECAQLLIKDEDDDTFVAYRPLGVSNDS